MNEEEYQKSEKEFMNYIKTPPTDVPDKEFQKRNGNEYTSDDANNIWNIVYNDLHGIEQ